MGELGGVDARRLDTLLDNLTALGTGVALGLIQALLYIGIAVIFGATIANGLTGLLIVLAIGAILAVATSGLGIYLALRTGSAEAVQGTFPLFLILLFFSSAFFPGRGSFFCWLEDKNNLS